MLQEGRTPTGISKGAVKIAANLTAADEEAFKQWKRDRATAKKEAPVKEGANKLNLFANTGRKFR